MTKSPCRSLRQRLFEESRLQCGPSDAASKDYDNSAITQEILALRREKALFLGFKSCQEYKVQKRFAASADAVTGLYNSLMPMAQRAARSDMQLLSDFALGIGIEEIVPWDLSYLVTEYEKNTIISILKKFVNILTLSM